ncbi:pullulanase-type alpha-1,6-glucosidase [Actinomyces radicidentis]|uniref:pullulanase-type alpha-1,6-glucosidase n=1 Tax=Actinomyces radicidentis TaxID=111015 RepID=UPI003F659CF2
MTTPTRTSASTPSGHSAGTPPQPPAHHEAPALVSVPGMGGARAYWVDETTLAWPSDLLPRGVDRAACVGPDGGRPDRAPDVGFGLVVSPDGDARIEDGIIHRGERGYEVPLGVIDELDPALVAAHPQLAGYLALTTADEYGGPRLAREDVEDLLRCRLGVVQRSDATTGGWITAFTGVQTWPLIDRLWGERAAARDGSAPLGATFHEHAGPDGAPAPRTPSFAVWAPTARDVALLSWETGDPTGSVPAVDGEPTRTPAQRRPDGRWEVPDGVVGPGAQYLWEVEVLLHTTGEVVTNRVTDPYSLALTVDSTRSVAVDLDQHALKPAAWVENLAPDVVSDAARSIYELHVRDFSAADATVPEELRGTYAAFGADSAGTRHLRRLAAAGIDTLHLLPTFDFATVPEDRARQRLPEIPEGTSPASRRPQAAVAAVADEDAFNWGYDPFHYQAPEGSYATAGHQDGGARTAEFRGMVGALHGMGLQVVLDQVYNHTSAAGQAPQSVLDRIVPGYYHRRDAAGAIEMSTCCNHVATEHAMAERLMIDSCVSWVQRYRVDGFRFDLMGYHSVDTMNRLREALDAVAEDAVGHPIFLYGEGWNMGEVANNALFTQAVQGQLGGTGVGTFNDRVRDALHGGTLFDVDPRAAQGLGTGELTDPNGRDERDEGSLRADLAWRTDLVRLSLAGNLRDMVLRTADGEHRRGEEIRYGDQSAAYGTEPVESIAYVDAHDDETLFDRLAYKLPIGTTMADRIRMNTVCLACVTLGQTPSFWAAGTEMLRSKSLDTDSYNSGDWFNAIDWSGQDNGWGRGLPPANRNFDQWIFQAELLSHEELRPSPHDIATATEAALDLLRLRRSSPLFSLGSAELVLERVSFPVGGDRAQPGVILMVIDDGAGEADLDPALDGLVIVINATPDEVEQQCDDLVGRFLELSEVQAEGADEVVRRTTFDRATGTVRVPGRTVAVLVEH